jgi:hypothetical protein
MRFWLVLFVLSSALAAQAGQGGDCEPAPAIRDELQTAAAVAITDPTAFDPNVAPFRALRQRHPANLFVHERYQDAVQQYGIEGHLRVLAQDYQALAAEHPDDVMYSYLAARALLGRSTPAAVANIAEILADHANFAPAHRMLAEIYGSEAFHDAEKVKTEREKFLALCPGSALTVRPAPLPARSPLIAQAEQLLADHGDSARIVAMATQGIRDDEWRLQRVRPFDWYSVEFKRQVQQELQLEYWRVWSIQVRCDRQAGQPEKAGELLDVMEQRAGRLSDRSASIYWEAQATLASLYIEGNQVPRATAKLAALSQFLSQHPDPERTARLEDLKKLMNAPKPGNL